MRESQLLKELANINGIYIPGDTKDSYEDEDYMQAVRRILVWSSEHNLDDAKHFPVVGVSWGMLSLLKSQTTQESLFKGLPESLLGAPLQQNLFLTPKETFIYDEVHGMDLEKTLDDVTFYHEMDEGVKLSELRTAQQLRHFVAVATFDQGTKYDSQGEEFVSTIEGTYFPFFGFAYRIDKVQFGFHAAAGEGHQHVDHSRKSIEHAQHVANMIVDEARLSPNRYSYTNDETERLVTNYDIEMVTLPSPHSFSEDKRYHSDYRTEMYLF